MDMASPSFTTEAGVRRQAARSDTKNVRFGIREITYELSLLDSAGHLRRVEYSPASARWREPTRRGCQPRRNAGDSARPIPPPPTPEEWRENSHSWVASLAPGAREVACDRSSIDRT